MSDEIDLSLEGRCGSCSQFVEDYGDKKAIYGHCGPKPRIGSVTNRDYKCDAYRLRPDFRRALEAAGETPMDQVPRRTTPARPAAGAATSGADAAEHAAPRRVRVTADTVPAAPRRAAAADDAPVAELSAGDLRALVGDALDDLLGLSELRLGDRWTGGTLVLRPANPSHQEKEIELERFWRKIVMVREQLRNLERALNGHEKLDDEDRIQLQQYITRIYGSLTTFNVLFKDKDDQFRGQKKG